MGPISDFKTSQKESMGYLAATFIISSYVQNPSLKQAKLNEDIEDLTKLNDN